MATDYPTIKITQSGSSGNYSYSLTGGYSQGANCPIFDVTWGDAARFCNWLQNGQPTFPTGTPGEVTNSTETGAYTLNGAVTNAALMGINRNGGATYFIPSENEWYKAAYYKGGNANAGYWAYPTQSDALHPPSNVLSTTGTNNANYDNGTYPSGTFTDPTNHLTPVGAFSASPGPYDTFDMGGDVWQWNEGTTLGCRYEWGGSWGNTYSMMAMTAGGYDYPANAFRDIGFRVASVPEPGSIMLVVAGGLCLLAYAWRRRV